MKLCDLGAAEPQPVAARRRRKKSKRVATRNANPCRLFEPADRRGIVAPLDPGILKAGFRAELERDAAERRVGRIAPDELLDDLHHRLLDARRENVVTREVSGGP